MPRNGLPGQWVRGWAGGGDGLCLRLLTQRFGEPRLEGQFRVRAASVDELTVWTDRFFRVGSTEDLLGLQC